MIEKWKSIKGYKSFYQVSNLGRIRSLDRLVKTHRGSRLARGRIISQTLDADGYLILRLHKKGIGKTFKAHRLVAQAFKRNPKNKPQVNHKNGTKTDNRAVNLEWSTSSENILHALNMGLNTTRGQTHHWTCMSNQDVIKINELLLENELTLQQIADKFKVRKGIINQIYKGES